MDWLQPTVPTIVDKQNPECNFATECNDLKSYDSQTTTMSNQLSNNASAYKTYQPHLEQLNE